jgi:hypothetical protein
MILNLGLLAGADLSLHAGSSRSLSSACPSLPFFATKEQYSWLTPWIVVQLHLRRSRFRCRRYLARFRPRLRQQIRHLD